MARVPVALQTSFQTLFSGLILISCFALSFTAIWIDFGEMSLDLFVDCMPLSNLFSGISGLFALIGGAVGLGFCCEKEEKTSDSHVLRGFFLTLSFTTSQNRVKSASNSRFL